MLIKGLLLIDGQKNTLIIPYDDPKLSDLITPERIKEIKRHKTLKELDATVREYIDSCKKGAS